MNSMTSNSRAAIFHKNLFAAFTLAPAFAAPTIRIMAKAREGAGGPGNS